MGLNNRFHRILDAMYCPLRPPLTLLLPVLLLISRARLSTCQRLPQRDDLLWNQVNTDDIIQDNSLLIDGAEMKAHIRPPDVQSYFFLVEEDNTPVSIKVTPCSEQIDWELFLMDLPEDGSGSSAADQLSEQRQRRQPNSAIGSYVAHFSGHASNEYITYSSPAGVYVLTVRGLGDATTFRIYCTTSPDSDHYYPELPSDPRVDVTSTHKNKVGLAWKGSPSVSTYQQPIQYCVAVNKIRNYSSWCGVLSFADVLSRGPRTKSQNRAREKEIRRAQRRQESKKTKNNKEGRDSVEEDDEILVECVGQKTLHTLTNLEPGQTYYVDLFAVDKSTNSSTVYTGTTITTKPGELTESKQIRLKDGKLRMSSVRRTNPVKVFTFPVGDEPQTAMFALQTCSQFVTMQIYQGEELLRESTVGRLKKFQIKKATGQLTIKVKSRRRKITHFRVFGTVNPDKFPFPSMPRGSRINVFKNLRQCNSVTLAWLSTKEDAHYCLYRRVDNRRTSPTSETSKPETNQCHGPDMRKKADKVLCRTVIGEEANLEVLTETVSDLEPDTTYVFDVYVTRSGYDQQSLAYKSKRVRTKRAC